VIADVRSVAVHGGLHARLPGRLARRDKGHAALLTATLRFFERGGEPPIPYERIVETTRATLVARDALARGEEAPQPLS
jgi:hypothetical protein